MCCFNFEGVIRNNHTRHFTMSVTADQLSKTSACGDDIKRIIEGLARAIDDTLMRAPKVWGRNCVSYQLPLNPGIPGLSIKDAQRVVYSSIIADLERRRFDVRIQLELATSTLYIAWETKLDIKEINAMSALIKAKRISAEEVRAFKDVGFTKSAGPKTQPPLVVTGKGVVMQPRGGLATAKEKSPATTPDENAVGPPGKASSAEAELIGSVLGSEMPK